MSAKPSTPSSSLAFDARELFNQERAIAAQFMGGVPWLAVVWGLANTGLWISLWPLAIMGLLPLWVAFVMATVSISICYLPSHEAQHDIIARPGEPLRWLNELVGHVAAIPLVLPLRTARLTHLEHHKHTNDPVLDPDIHTKAPNAWSFLIQSVANRQPGAAGARSYGATLRRIGTPEAARAGRDALYYQFAYLAILSAVSWSGHAAVALLVWWLPRQIASTYIGFFLSWAPHHPGTQTGRYRDTRGFRSMFGLIGSMGMEYHIVHHLHPRIPLLRTPAAFRALRPILVARGCDLGGL